MKMKEIVKTCDAQHYYCEDCPAYRNCIAVKMIFDTMSPLVLYYERISKLREPNIEHVMEMEVNRE